MDPNKPLELPRGLLAFREEVVFFLADVLPRGRPRLAVLLVDEAYWREPFLVPGLRCLALVVSVIFGIIAQMVFSTL